MIAFVDYDNLPETVRRRGALGLALRVATEALRLGATTPTELALRLYGGWRDTSGGLTHDAQQIVAAIATDFAAPQLLRVPLSSGRYVSIAARVSLAQSLLADPRRVLLHTYRDQARAPSVRARNSTDLLCSLRPCFCECLSRFMTTKACLHPACTRTSDEILFRREQKLVDGMMISDLIYYASQSVSPTACVVSSDDDLIPGIISALAQRAVIVHLLTRSNPPHVSYTTDLGERYLQGAL